MRPSPSPADSQCLQLNSLRRGLRFWLPLAELWGKTSHGSPGWPQSLGVCQHDLSFKGTPCNNTNWLGRSLAVAQVTPTTSSVCLKKTHRRLQARNCGLCFASSFTVCFLQLHLMPSLQQTSSCEEICIKKGRFWMLGAYINRDVLSWAVIAMFHLCGQDTSALPEIQILIWDISTGHGL